MLCCLDGSADLSSMRTSGSLSLSCGVLGPPASGSTHPWANLDPGVDPPFTLEMLEDVPSRNAWRLSHGEQRPWRATTSLCKEERPVLLPFSLLGTTHSSGNMSVSVILP